MAMQLGTTKYPFTAYSPSDNIGLGFATKEDAQYHADCMNDLIQFYDYGIILDKSYWKTKPMNWVVETTE